MYTILSIFVDRVMRLGVMSANIVNAVEKRLERGFMICK